MLDPKQPTKGGLMSGRTGREIADEALKSAGGDVQSAIDALWDGEYLAKAGYTDEDQGAIEEACEILRATK